MTRYTWKKKGITFQVFNLGMFNGINGSREPHLLGLYLLKRRLGNIDGLTVPATITIHYTPFYLRGGLTGESTFSAVTFQWGQAKISAYHDKRGRWLLTGCTDRKSLFRGHGLHSNCGECGWTFGSQPSPHDLYLQDSWGKNMNEHEELQTWLAEKLALTANPLWVELHKEEFLATVQTVTARLS